MSPAPRDTIKRSVSLGFALLVLCIGCSDSDGGGGGGGKGGTGNTEAGASSGRASAGTSGSQGTSGASGSNAGSKGNECDIQECLVANTCLDDCGGSVVYTGCCACVPPAVNRNRCTPDK